MGNQSRPQSLLDQRRQHEFVGREDDLAFFRNAITVAPGEDRFRPIMNLVGDGGVGKTWLMRQIQQVADRTGVWTAYSDGTQKNLPAVMDHIASQFEQRDLKMKNFRSRYNAYLKNINLIRADPKAPQGLTDMLGRLAIRATFVAGDLVPGLRVGLKFLPQDQLETMAGEWVSFVAKKITNKDEVRLALEPIQVLTPLFLKDIQNVAADHSPLVLFLDSYDKTGEYLDPWLRDLLAGEYGAWPQDVRLVIAGRGGLNRTQWADFLGLVVTRHLSPFSEGEARAYLKQKGIVDQGVVDVILNLSQRLPLLVATLAAERPEDPKKVVQPGGDAIEHFLRSGEDPERRDVALAASLPRKINRDILAVLVGKEHAGPMFAWLCDMPFVDMSQDGWIYHDIVRTLMLRHERLQSPQDWIDRNEKLAVYFELMLGNLGLQPEHQFKNASWRKFALEAAYHRLCQAYPRYEARLLNYFVKAILAQTAFAHAWAAMIAQAERDLEIEPEKSWGIRLADGLQAFDENRYPEACQMFTALLNHPGLENPCRAAALARRGLTYRLQGNPAAAITDLNEAVELDPTDVWTLVQRGEAHRQHGDYEEAIADYEKAIQLEPDSSWAIILKAETYRESGRYDEALKEFQAATEKDPENAWITVLQSEAYRQMGHYPEALAGFDRAVRLAPNYAFAITHRGEAYRQAGQVERALDDFNHALELDSNFTWAWILRGDTKRQLGQIESAIEDLSQAIELDPKDPWPRALRGEAYRQIRRTQEALADYDKAIELRPNYTWPMTLRGEAQRDIGLFPEALTEYDRVLELEPRNAWALTLRGETHLQMGDLDAALTDFSDALAVDPRNSWVLTHRSRVYRDLGQYERALADCTQALTFHPNYAWALAQRGETYRQTGRFEEALADLSRAIELEPNNSWTLARRGETYRQVGRHKESLRDLNQALVYDPKNLWPNGQRVHLDDLLEFHQDSWRTAYVDQVDKGGVIRVLEIYYGIGNRRFQYAALHLDSAYFRMVYDPASEWGTSVILLPTFWSKATLYQGRPVVAQPRVDGTDLILDIEGIIGELRVACQLRIHPPAEASLRADVRVQLKGGVDLDDRPGEAFKPVMLSSMHISSVEWDTQSAYIGRDLHEIPESRWIIPHPEAGKRFGLRGGSTDEKKNAPTIIIELDRPLQITGWVTSSTDRNDDNVGLWAASDKLLTAWEYTIQAAGA